MYIMKKDLATKYDIYNPKSTIRQFIQFDKSPDRIIFFNIFFNSATGLSVAQATWTVAAMLAPVTDLVVSLPVAALLTSAVTVGEALFIALIPSFYRTFMEDVGVWAHNNHKINQSDTLSITVDTTELFFECCGLRGQRDFGNASLPPSLQEKLNRKFLPKKKKNSIRDFEVNGETFERQRREKEQPKSFDIKIKAAPCCCREELKKTENDVG